MSIIFKYKSRASASSKEEVVATLSRAKVSARPLVDNPPKDLANIYLVDLPRTRERAFITKLSELKAVEYAEATPKRRVI